MQPLYSPEFVQALLDTIPLPLALIRLKDSWIFLSNQRFQKLFPRKRLQLNYFQECLAHPKRFARLQEGFREGPVVDALEEEMIQASGESLPMQIHAERVEFEGSEAVLVTLRSVQTKADPSKVIHPTQVLESPGKLGLSLPDIIFRVDPQGNYLEVLTPDHPNLIAPPEQIVGSNRRDWFDEEYCAAFEEASERALRTRQVINFTYQIELHGKVRWSEARILALNDHELMLSIRDQTELRMLQQERLQQSKMVALGEISTQLAHRINSPTAAILVAVRNLTEPVSEHLSPQAAQTLRNIEISAKSIEETVAQVGDLALDWSIDWEHDIDLREVLQDSARGIQKWFPEVFWIWALPEQKILIEGNRAMLVNLFSNVLENACTAAKELEEPTVRVEMIPQEQDVQVTFEDSGPGFTEFQLDHATEAFFASQDLGGLGLNLMIARMLIQQHQGRIVLEDESPYLGGGMVLLSFPYHRSRVDFGKVSWSTPEAKSLPEIDKQNSCS